MASYPHGGALRKIDESAEASTDLRLVCGKGDVLTNEDELHVVLPDDSLGPVIYELYRRRFREIRVVNRRRSVRPDIELRRPVEPEPVVVVVERVRDVNLVFIDERNPEPEPPRSACNDRVLCCARDTDLADDTTNRNPKKASKAIIGKRLR